MAELKSMWRRVKLGEVAVNSTAATKDPIADGYERYIIGKHIPEDGSRILTWNPVGDAEFGSRIRTMFRAGDVICTTRGPKLKVAVPEFDGLSAHTNFILRTRDENVLLQSILEALVRSDGFQEHLRKHFRGSTNLFVNWSDAAEYEFVLPPLEEQRRAAALLKAAGAVVASYQHVVETGTMARRACGKQYFVTGAEGRRCTINDVADVRNGTTPNRGVESYWNGTLPWLPTGKVNERQIFTADEFITEKALRECSLGGVMPVGATLLAMIGEGITRGKVARLEIQACINQNFAAIVPRGDVESWFIFYYLESHYESLRRWSQGTNQQALNCSLIRAFPIVVPPIERQRAIVRILREIDEKVSLAEDRLLEAKQQLQLAAAEALSGPLS